MSTTPATKAYLSATKPENVDTGFLAYLSSLDLVKTVSPETPS